MVLQKYRQSKKGGSAHPKDEATLLFSTSSILFPAI